MRPLQRISPTSWHASGRLGDCGRAPRTGKTQAHANALVPRPETGKINRVRRPCCGRLSPGAQSQRQIAVKVLPRIVGRAEQRERDGEPDVGVFFGQTILGAQRCRIGRMSSLYLPIDRQARRDAAFSAALG
jgi:hypothetical protein